MENENPTAQGPSKAYQRASLSITLILLAIWFTASFGCGILFRDWLDANAPQIGNAKFGFWMAQQGSIISFVLILIVYAVLMKKLDLKHGYSESEESSNEKEGK